MATGVEVAVVTVSVDDPGVMIELGLKLAVAPEGCPLALRLTIPVNPRDGTTFTV